MLTEGGLFIPWSVAPHGGIGEVEFGANSREVCLGVCNGYGDLVPYTFPKVSPVLDIIGVCDLL